MATLITPEGKISTITPKNGLAFTTDELHSLVDGYLECVYLSNGRLMWIDEEGKLKDKRPNMVATFIALDVLMPGDVIVGNAVITTLSEAGEET